jgi:oligoribonuclease (3'-5' exoribonuclease)
VSFAIHFHGGELQKLIKLCVEAYMTGAKSLMTKGSCKKSDERYRRVEEKLIGFTKNLIPDQWALIDGSFKQ